MSAQDIVPSFETATDISSVIRARRAAKRQQIVLRCIAVLLILAAICAGGFPAFMQYRSSRELAAATERASRRVHDWPEPLADNAFAAAQAYNKRLATSTQPVLGEAADPFGVSGGTASKSSQDTEYHALLDAGNGVMGSIRIPKISVDLPIYHGTSQSSLVLGAGHLYGSSLPVGGSDTHAVITGHRGMVEAAMFTRLDEMGVGDYFYIKQMNRTLGYRVDRISVIDPSDTSKLRIVPGEDRVTLMTCTPYGINTHRLLISALRSHMPDQIPYLEDAVGDARHVGIGVGAVLLCAGLAVIWLRRRPWHIRRHAAAWPDQR
ncbi:class C sortase [Bifidobacterium sp. 64T4]|uniref:class C sortase n=1 Tax=Bifidobacterium pongonis TaxID=2834432 RepID=UPI001C57497A|nr:class C sortase [Bifidobacterium pongonis]MBW3095507.1 class C sortase [Bifidobacterium pongonis]